jgi:hypothetical protein
LFLDGLRGYGEVEESEVWVVLGFLFLDIHGCIGLGVWGC